jgi:hypothetical protein
LASLLARFNSAALLALPPNATTPFFVVTEVLRTLNSFLALPDRFYRWQPFHSGINFLSSYFLSCFSFSPLSGFPCRGLDCCGASRCCGCECCGWTTPDFGRDCCGLAASRDCGFA